MLVTAAWVAHRLMFPQGHPYPWVFSVGCSPWGLSLPQCEVPVGHSSSGLDLPWCGSLIGHSFSAVSLPWCEVAVGPQMYHRPSCVDRLFPGVHLQSCPFPHVFSHVPQIFPFMPASPGSYSLLSNMWELFKSSLGIKAV